MCQACIERHISGILSDAAAQFQSPDCSGVRLELSQLDPCKPFDGVTVPPAHRARTIKFPGNTPGESASFAVLVRLLALIGANLREGKTVTTRDLYYQDVALFRSQRVVARAVEQLSRYFLVPRAQFNVFSAPSGLVAGDLTIALENGDLYEIRRSNGPSLIPVYPILNASATKRPAYILVVEKEAVFSYLQAELTEGVVVTGRGFPDRATRTLLTALSVTYPQVPVYGLVDADPHGILILHTYECGASRSVEVQERIGVRYLGISLLEYSEGLVPLTATDRSVAMSTLRKAWVHEPRYWRYRRELQRCLFMGLKGEMNLMDGEQSARLSNYVRSKVNRLAFAPERERPVRQPRLCRFAELSGRARANCENVLASAGSAVAADPAPRGSANGGAKTAAFDPPDESVRAGRSCEAETRYAAAYARLRPKRRCARRLFVD